MYSSRRKTKAVFFRAVSWIAGEMRSEKKLFFLKKMIVDGTNTYSRKRRWAGSFFFEIIIDGRGMVGENKPGVLKWPNKPCSVRSTVSSQFKFWNLKFPTLKCNSNTVEYGIAVHTR
jgi:hypothetical protein